MAPGTYSQDKVDTAKTVRGGLVAIPLALPLAAGMVSVLVGWVDTLKGLGEVVAGTLALVVAVVAIAVELRFPPTVTELRNERTTLAYFRDFATSIVAPIIIFLALVFGDTGLSNDAQLGAGVAGFLLLVAAFFVVKRGLPVNNA